MTPPPNKSQVTIPLKDGAVMIERPNTLIVKTGGPLSAQAVAKAEMAVELLSTQFHPWLEEVVNKMIAARQALAGQPLTAHATRDFYTAALEAKSLGETYGYPFVSRFSHSLCRLLVRLKGDKTAPDKLVDAHLDAIRAVLREQCSGSTNPLGLALAAELEQQVALELGSVSP